MRAHLIGLALAIGLFACGDDAPPLQPPPPPDVATVSAHARIRGLPGADINATLELAQHGETLSVTGRGTHFDRDLAYVSLVYDAASACAPMSGGALTAPQMMLGYWLPLGNAFRTLTAVKVGAGFVGLDAIGSASVQRDLAPAEPITAPDTTRLPLKACGSVVRDTT